MNKQIAAAIAGLALVAGVAAYSFTAQAAVPAPAIPASQVKVKLAASPDFNENTITQEAGVEALGGHVLFPSGWELFTVQTAHKVKTVIDFTYYHGGDQEKIVTIRVEPSAIDKGKEWTEKAHTITNVDNDGKAIPNPYTYVEMQDGIPAQMWTTTIQNVNRSVYPFDEYPTTQMLAFYKDGLLYKVQGVNMTKAEVIELATSMK